MTHFKLCPVCHRVSPAAEITQQGRCNRPDCAQDAPRSKAEVSGHVDRMLGPQDAVEAILRKLGKR